MKKLVVLSILAILLSTISWAQDTLQTAQTEAAQANAAELAKKLANPVASLISVPFQNNTDVGIGDDNGYKNTLNVQPVIPITLSKKLNLITRYIFPVVSQKNITGEGTSQSGLGDATISAFSSSPNNISEPGGRAKSRPF